VSENPGDISGIACVGFLRTTVTNSKNTAMIISRSPFPFLFCELPNTGPKIQLNDSLGPSVLTESDLDEKVMSIGNCHRFVGLGSRTGRKKAFPSTLSRCLMPEWEIPQLGVIRSLSVRYSGAIAVWEYTRQQRAQIAATPK
jgi:hypothetical protein